MWIVLATAPPLLLDPWDLVRVDDPDHPEAIARSETAALLSAPPDDGTPWTWASIPETDAFPAVEALEVSNADLWHADGVTGAGVKIAVFDTGWWIGNSDADELGDVILHDCFLSPTCEVPFDPLRPDLRFSTGVHGLACAEVIHDLAPDAELHLVRVNSLVALENAADWAIREGIDLISMSLSYTNDSFYDGTGPHAALVERLEANDVLMVTSAGNNARSHWFSDWRDADNDGLLDGDGDDGLWIEAGGSVTVYVNWNQHGIDCGDTDLDAWLVGDDRTILAAGDSEQLPITEEGQKCSPTERLRATLPEDDALYRLEIAHQRGRLSDLTVDVLARGGDIVGSRPERSITDPGAHPLAFAVGAVDANRDYLTVGPEGFSSWGPNHAGHPKPDIAGPDGLSTDSYGPVGFYGTSASTPAVVGMLALVLADDPDLTPRGAAERIQAWAWRDGTGHDPRFGAGKARLPERERSVTPCGRRPLVMPLLFLPVWWFRKRRRSNAPMR